MEGTSIPVRRSRARTQMVANRIRHQILSGAWANGRLLPSERDMAAQFGIARNTLRRIIQQLEAEGLIESHPGRGSFVRLSPLGDQMSRADPPTTQASQADLLEMRSLLEPLVAELAAKRITPEEISALEAVHQNAIEAKDPATLDHWFSEMHRALWRAAGNAALWEWYEAIDRQLPPRRATTVHLQSLAALVAALRDLDAELAHETMRNLMRRRDAHRPLVAVHA
ncbi:MAG TPA: GntR family transcriptional regulator [Dongiaceae bacterium]|nr:GntR family transcriptional regulator [Dongiaceae bacterium]